MLKLIILVVLMLPNFAYGLEDPRYCGPPERRADGRIVRSTKVLNDFKKMYPCPSTGEDHGNCPGWAIDHVVPRVCGGCDTILNLQWLPNEIKSGPGDLPKDRWERKVYCVH